MVMLVKVLGGQLVRFEGVLMQVLGLLLWSIILFSS